MTLCGPVSWQYFISNLMPESCAWLAGQPNSRHKHVLMYLAATAWTYSKAFWSPPNRDASESAYSYTGRLTGPCVFL